MVADPRFHLRLQGGVDAVPERLVELDQRARHLVRDVADVVRKALRDARVAALAVEREELLVQLGRHRRLQEARHA